MTKNLFRQEPNQDEERFPYDEGAKRRFKLEKWEQEILEAEETLWRGDTAFWLE